MEDPTNFDSDDFGSDEESINSKSKLKLRKSSALNVEEDEYVEKEKPIASVDEIPTLVKNLIYGASKSLKVKKALRKLELTDSVPVLRRFLQLHGLNVLKSIINMYTSKDIMVCSRVLEILNKLPIQTRNPIIDFQMEICLKKLTDIPEMHTAMLAKSVSVLICIFWFL